MLLLPLKVDLRKLLEGLTVGFLDTLVDVLEPRTGLVHLLLLDHVRGSRHHVTTALTV